MPSSWSAQSLFAAAIVIGTAVSMELFAWLVHRHWMHGMGWGWHRSHHERSPGGRFERNDLFGMVFAGMAIGFILAGNGAWWPLYWVGIGMTVYGLMYVVLHDGLVHRRWPLPWTPRHGYLRRLIQAHRLHHAVTSRQGAVSFGFLYAPPVTRLKAELRAQSLEPNLMRSSPNRSTQTMIGLLLAFALVGTWLIAQFYGLFLYPWGNAGVMLAPLFVAFICWLDVGLFIVAHDAMHGSLVPTNRRLNHAVGRLCLALYAGFALGRFTPHHFEHHRSPGTAGDPDFHVEAVRFWPWYYSFMRRYFGWREAGGLVVIFGLLTLVLRASWLNVLVFWALPAALSSVQLFAFGTWLPHRRAATAFDDHHHARSNAYGWFTSLITCFHFGYHHEHHLRPDAPWWRLPAVRRSLTAPPFDPGFSTGSRAASVAAPRSEAPTCQPSQ